MKFRYKVLLSNIILLSVLLGIISYIVIDQNFHYSLDTGIENAVKANNILQSAIDIRILDLYGEKKDISVSDLNDIASEVNNTEMTLNTQLFIRYENSIIFCDHALQADFIPHALFSKLSLGQKKYILKKEGASHFIYVTSYNTINGKDLYIINRSNISAPYAMMMQQIRFMKYLTAFALVICSIFMYLISFFLTRPLVKLSKASSQIAQGNYDARCSIHTKDELAMLSDSFNTMADSISHHIVELEDMVKKRDQFVADFTHEIKTPLTTIIGYADMIRSKELSRERQILAGDYIVSEGKRLESLSFKLFDLIYLRNHDICFSQISIPLLVMNVTGSVTPALTKKNIQLQTDCKSGTVYGDFHLLETMLINLIDNAKKASKEGDSILFTGQISDDGYVMKIQDHGIGMSDEQKKHIFDEFYMADKSRSRKEGGAGLGLSLVSIILSHHHCTMEIDSAPLQGTCITLHFPNDSPGLSSNSIIQ